MNYFAIGLMSGTSLDGIDIAFCEFRLQDSKWFSKIHQAETIPYSRQWRDRLGSAGTGRAIELITLDRDYGHLLGSLTRIFIEKHRIHPDFIASHGHTVFHRPEDRLTLQIGHGPAIRAETGIPVICDFRSLDVALGGQGAPLVPIGDRLLFSDYEICLNLGGFANISFDSGGKRIAYDTGPANIVLNELASRSGYDYDKDGLMARQGTIDQGILNALNALPYYSVLPPKSLGKEWVEQNVSPLIAGLTLPVCDLLATFCEHIAIQIGHATRLCAHTGSFQGAPALVKDQPIEYATLSCVDRDGMTGIQKTNNHHVGHSIRRMLMTGGGALNTFLTERIAHYADAEVVIPDRLTVEFKEALIFAFLGVLRWRNESNCLKSVTGAITDSSGGGIF